MARVLVIGLAVMDFVFQVDALPVEARTCSARGVETVSGGCAANAAQAITRLEGEAILGTWPGFDYAGELIVFDLQRKGEDTKHVQRTEGARSTFGSVNVSTVGQRQIMNFRKSDLVAATVWIADVSCVDADPCDSRWSEGAIAALKLARKAGISGTVDAEAPVAANAPEHVSRVALSRQGLLSLVRDADLPAALNKSAAQLDARISVTDGVRGVWHSGPNGIGYAAACPVEVRNALAAGDVWHGAFAPALGEGRDEVGLANAKAAIKCGRPRGRNGAPSRAKVEDFLKERTP